MPNKTKAATRPDRSVIQILPTSLEISSDFIAENLYGQIGLLQDIDKISIGFDAHLSD
jgi:hypothetical protein